MRPAGTRRRSGPLIVALVTGLALVVAGCGDDTPASVVRDPLASPPDPGPVPEAHGLPESLVAEVLASTVGVTGTACGLRTNGSGFAIANDLVATNAHVLLGLGTVDIRTFDGRDLVGTPVAFDPVTDLAVVEVPDAGLTPLPLADEADDGSVGALVGWDDGTVADPVPYRIDRPVTVRIEAVASEERIERRSWLVAAEIERGDSGAALVDDHGSVVGIAYATSRQGSGVGYAVRASELDALVDRGFDANLTVPDC